MCGAATGGHDGLPPRALFPCANVVLVALLLGGVVNDWLYPLSSKSGYWFEMPDGSRTNDTSPASFEASVLRASADESWTVAQNFKQINVGDRVWVYSVSRP